MTASSEFVSIRLIGNKKFEPGPRVILPRVVKSDSDWKKQLGEKAYYILRAQGTEPPFCNPFVIKKEKGVYFCKGCALPLFASTSKFESGTGWPSFFKPYALENILTRLDLSHGMKRQEILCTRCEGHLGHRFPDGPLPTGLRYCLNEAALTFQTEEEINS